MFLNFHHKRFPGYRSSPILSLAGGDSEVLKQIADLASLGYQRAFL